MNKSDLWSCIADKSGAEKYKQYFRDHKICFEPSEYGENIYISLLASDEEAAAFNEWIEEDLMPGSVS